MGALAMPGRFPGLYRPGLIEVARAPGSRRPRKEGFRGFTAPASLKSGAPTPGGALLYGFRGFTAPASLK